MPLERPSTNVQFTTAAFRLARSRGAGRIRAWHVDCSSVLCRFDKRSLEMLWTIFVILLILWLLGMVNGATLGGFIHLLLILAIVVVLIRVIQGRRPI